MFEIIFTLSLLTLGYFFGTRYEKIHFNQLIKNEDLFRNILVIPEKKIPEIYKTQEYSNKLVSGNVVISVDYFKRFLAGLRAFFGGRVTSYETLLERARREAVLRMKQQAKDNKAIAVFNCKLETASISKGAGGAIGSVEVYAYGTAIIPRT